MFSLGVTEPERFLTNGRISIRLFFIVQGELSKQV